MADKSPIAVVGMAGIFPGSNNLDEFWLNIVNKIGQSKEIPKDRWIAPKEFMYDPDPQPDKAYSKYACLINNFKFDPNNFNIDPELVNSLDPLYHIVLYCGKTAIENSNISSIKKDRIGVSLAAIVLPTDGSTLITRKIFGKAFEEKIFSGVKKVYEEKHSLLKKNQFHAARVSGFPAALLARALKLGGGSFTLDAACASSIYAVKLACDELDSKRADLMLAGGVSRPDALFTQVGFSQLRALSPSGRCSPFDENADGLVVGEGAGIIVLKRLDDALKDKDVIFGLIRGIGLSNDMRGNLLAPDSEGQVRAMKQAYENASWMPDDVDYIECHGAGTPVGDAVELESLMTLWDQFNWNKGQCPIGSIKSMTGHLLTAAGITGIIKMLLAIKNKTLPPSINFNKPPQNSPLNESPFKIQTIPEKWRKRDENTPRRAAVSAFGFGGVNSHILIEEWIDKKQSQVKPIKSEIKVIDQVLKIPLKEHAKSNAPIAIIGMDAVFGSIDSLLSFKDHIFKGRSNIKKLPQNRWKGTDNFIENTFGIKNLYGGFIDKFDIYASSFHVPPSEIKDILPQQLLMLKVSANAMKDAGLALRQKREKMGAIIGIGFDFEATNFHLRWNMHNETEKWRNKHLDYLEKNEFLLWKKELMNESCPALTATRTLGDLGSITASRIASEFQLGGPSFTVSNEEASGLKALEIAVRFLQRYEIDLALAGAVDLFCDVRNLLIRNHIRQFSRSGSLRPFDEAADGTLPGEGAAAVVLKRLDNAIKDGDRIYSIIRGIGKANEETPETEKITKETYIRSMIAAFSDADLEPIPVSMIETHGSGDPYEDDVEADSINTIFSGHKFSGQKCAIGTIKPVIGHTGAVAGIASLVKTSICLYHNTIPPFINYNKTVYNWDNEKFYMPEFADHFEGEKQKGTIRAVAGSIAIDGNCTHVVLEQSPYKTEPVLINKMPEKPKTNDKLKITVAVGGRPFNPRLPEKGVNKNSNVNEYEVSVKDIKDIDFDAKIPFLDLMESMTQINESTIKAHKTFLSFSEQVQKSFLKTFELQNRILKSLSEKNDFFENEAAFHWKLNEKELPASQIEGLPKVLFPRDMCLEFAVGSVSRVLGPEFEIVDSFKKRVRLPDEPLMLVDRIISIEGEKLSLSSGKIVTEHDVLPCAWYLDGGRAPVCISVEAGQADLFLCSYLGIDHRVKGERVYRLLDASVVFHRGLPVEGETIRYEIEIDKFVRRGETYLFFFHFKGYIGATPLITMTDGCAGFFTDEEIKNSGGIILTEEDRSAAPETIKTEWNDFIQVERKEILDYSLNALRLGDAEKCFGGSFRGITIGEQLRLPGGRMKLIDRILDLDPKGGRSGLGLIKAEADIHPDDWFLTCHFSDDMVMPGTLMYECCAHTLRVFVQQTGWISDKPGTCYEPLTGVKSILKCRGPVTPETKHVHYEVEIKQTGYNPEPYVIADARMYTDGHLIVLFKDMSLKMTGITKEELEAFWTRQKQNLKLEHIPPPLFDREKLVEFALGKPSKAFGEPYKIFDENRFIARLPNPPYLFIDKIIHCEPEPWILKPDGWIKALFEVRKDDWYFISNKSPVMPYSVLLETALQSCGWLAAYMGSALKSKKDLRFRNLGRSGILHKNISQKNTSLVTAARLKQASVTKDMIIEKFEFKVSENDITIFEGNTEFGFFTLEALKQQTGIIDAEKRSYIPSTYELENKKAIIFHPEPPLRPYDSGKNEVKLLNYLWTSPTLTTLIDEIETYLPHGGPFGFGYIRGKKYVDPDEWFFKAHFFQDPVCPGSLGVESFIQLLKFAALEIWGDKAHHHKFEMVTGKEHQWKYRGQITPENKIVEVEAVITEIKNAPEFVIMANGLLKVDGLYIYEMNNFGIKYNAL